MKLKIITINLVLLIIIYLISDVFFSKFIFKQSVDHKCFEHLNQGRFYQMKKNCFSNMRMISSIDFIKFTQIKKEEDFQAKK